MRKKYSAPEVKITYVLLDIITYSEEDVWEGPAVDAGDETD